MYNSTMNNTIEMGYVIEHLTRQEIARLKKMALGYGKFKRTAAQSGLHVNTFRTILDRGYGIPENVEKIRVNLLGATA